VSSASAFDGRRRNVPVGKFLFLRSRLALLQVGSLCGNVLWSGRLGDGSRTKVMIGQGYSAYSSRNQASLGPAVVNPLTRRRFPRLTSDDEHHRHDDEESYRNDDLLEHDDSKVPYSCRLRQDFISRLAPSPPLAPHPLGRGDRLTVPYINNISTTWIRCLFPSRPSQPGRAVS
jgi:hypothetical protein